MQIKPQHRFLDRAMFGAGLTSFAVALTGTLWPLVA